MKKKPRFGGAFLADANWLYAFKGRGFGGEIGLGDQKETPHKYLVC